MVNGGAIYMEAYMNMKVENKSNNVSIVTLDGTLVGPERSQNLKREIDKLIENNISKIILDLKEVSYTDSTGIGTMLIGYKRVHRQ